VDIQKMPPEVIVCVRVECRRIILQMEWNKGLQIGRGPWQESLGEIVGQLAFGSTASEVSTFTKNIREYFRTGVNLTNGVIHYRVNKGGVLESAEVDFTEDPAPLEFEQATIPRQ
jgi:hypothetical protein